VSGRAIQLTRRGANVERQDRHRRTRIGRHRCIQPLAEFLQLGRTSTSVVDEDYKEFGVSGELAARVLEAGVTPSYARVCVEDTLPFARDKEAAALPNVTRIERAVRALFASREA